MTIRELIKNLMNCNDLDDEVNVRILHRDEDNVVIKESLGVDVWVSHYAKNNSVCINVDRKTMVDFAG
jgi:hypothetical protein